jgi:hypothetical protein
MYFLFVSLLKFGLNVSKKENKAERTSRGGRGSGRVLPRYQRVNAAQRTLLTPIQAQIPPKIRPVRSVSACNDVNLFEEVSDGSSEPLSEILLSRIRKSLNYQLKNKVV